MEIKKVKLSRVLCDNSDNIVTIQPFAMELPSQQKYVLFFNNYTFLIFFYYSGITVKLIDWIFRNNRVACKGHILPQMDLWAWKEYTGCCTKKKVSIF